MKKYHHRNNSTNNEDKITSFCNALQRGDYRAAERFLTIIGAGSVAAGGKVFCFGLNNICPILEGQR